MSLTTLPLSLADGIGLALWLFATIGYPLIALRLSRTRVNVSSSTAPFRRQWMREAWTRENRVADSSLVGNLMQSATFFSSTTLLILGGLFALLGSLGKGQSVLETLPFGNAVPVQVLEVKALLLAVLLAYAFLRFTWSLRQFNLVNIVLGAYPSAKPVPPIDEALVERAARLNELAGANFTAGIRAYYFAMPLVLWLLTPWMLGVGTVIISGALYWMEFRSETAAALRLD